MGIFSSDAHPGALRTVQRRCPRGLRRTDKRTVADRRTFGAIALLGLAQLLAAVAKWLAPRGPLQRRSRWPRVVPMRFPPLPTPARAARSRKRPAPRRQNRRRAPPCPPTTAAR